MGNNLGKRRQVVDDKYTRPQGLYQLKDVDFKKLRKLILDFKLAPCYPGGDDCDCDLEECPICFLYYPSLNRSKCCKKSICTECFLQMKTPNSSRLTQCPFCKSFNYAVEYRGVKTDEEKLLEQLEEQRVIEAKIRIRQKEMLDEEKGMPKQRETCSTSRSTDNSSSSDIEESGDENEWGATSAIRQLPSQRKYRKDEYDIDLDFEDIMLMEAIWLSIQESGRHHEPACSNAAPPHSQMGISEDDDSSTSEMPQASRPSTSASLAHTSTAFAECQNISNSYPRDTSSYSSSHEQEPDARYEGLRRDREGHHEIQLVGGSIAPESFEEQMMLALAVS